MSKTNPKNWVNILHTFYLSNNETTSIPPLTGRVIFSYVFSLPGILHTKCGVLKLHVESVSVLLLEERAILSYPLR